MPRKKTFDRDVVLEKAMELFWKKGYHATSMQDLVDHLGINRASMYTTFGDKRALFGEAFSLYLEQSQASVQQFLAGYSHVKVGLRALFEQSICETLEDPDRKGCFVVNATTEFVPGTDPIIPVIQAAQYQSEAVFHAYLLQGEAHGDIPPGKDLKGLATLIFTYFNGIRILSKTHESDQKLKATIDLVLGLLD